jgi:hypothetical protein
MKVIKLFVYMLVVFFSISLVLAADANLTQKQLAEKCLIQSESSLVEISNSNISVNRFNDSYVKAKNLYDAQVIIESRKSKADFAQVISYCDQIDNLKKTAIDSLDYFDVFLNFYNDTVDKSVMNASSIDAIIDQINQEIKGERYEGIVALVDSGYTEITAVKSEQTTLALAYKATTRNLKDFFKENGLTIIIVLGILIVFYLIYRTKIKQYLLNRKLKTLILRRDTLKKLIGDTQKEYFQTGKLPESDYRIRTKNFADLIRDIDRQIPLLQKEIAEYSSKDDLKRLEIRDKQRLRNAA